MTAVRLLLGTDSLELLRRRVLAPALDLPPGFRSATAGAATPAALDRAAAALRRDGVLTAQEEVSAPVAADLHVLAQPELAVLVRARRPGLDVTAAVAVRGGLGAGLLRTGPTAVQLSAFPASDLGAELARVVPTPFPTAVPAARTAATVPLDALLEGSTAGGAAGRLRAATTGTLRAVVVHRGGTAGSVTWVLDGGGWTGLQPLPSSDGRPQVRLVPVGPEDLVRWVAPLAAAALA